MAVLSIPGENVKISFPTQIKSFLSDRGVFFDQWVCGVELSDEATQEEILEAYKDQLRPFMEKGGYKVADVISINKGTENYLEIRNKFLAEHIHTEDEIRFFIAGKGLFWFHMEDQPVFNLLCEQGDLISVPAGCKHWFDAGIENPYVRCIRIFTETSGWTPHYTEENSQKEFENITV